MTPAEIVRLPPITSPNAAFPGAALLAGSEAGESAKPLTVWTPDQLLAWTPPKDDVILGEADRGYIVREELTVIIGPPGVGKSRLLMWCAICGITGRQFAGLGIHNSPTKWLLIGNENSRRSQRYDLERMLPALTDAERDLVRNNLRLHVLDTTRDSLLDLGDKEARDAIGATVLATGWPLLSRESAAGKKQKSRTGWRGSGSLSGLTARSPKQRHPLDGGD